MLKLLLSLLIATGPAVSHAIEEPSYTIVRQLAGADGMELRLYAPYVVAQVLVSGPADNAGNEAFPILAGYIFGKNKGARKLEMTAPVIQAAGPAVTQPTAQVKLDTTAPVTQAAAAGGYVVQFVLPKGVTLASAPEPIDPRVQLREVPGRQLAVIRYSGLWSESNYAEHLAVLQAALQAAQLTWTGEPVLSRYNAPFTPWFMRRNEIWLNLQQPS